MLQGQALLRQEGHAMSDDDIHRHLPHAKIMTYKELAHYPNLNALLTKPKDYAILLYESSPNNGHWTGIMRYNNQVEYFDPYGGKPDAPLHWVDANTRQQLGEGNPLLSQMLAQVPHCHNTVRYQKMKQGINDCGRHTVHRILAMLDDISLNDYHHFMDELAHQLHTDYDGVVTMRVT
jgi:hypothetical protein